MKEELVKLGQELTKLAEEVKYDNMTSHQCDVLDSIVEDLTELLEKA